MTTADYAARVYDYHRDYAALHGYAPVGANVCHALRISRRDYHAALRWLVERRFLTHQARRWRGVRINVRLCKDCGVEITPQNAIIEPSRGRLFVRGRCYACFYAVHNRRDKAWRDRNPGYVARRVARERQRQQRGASA